MFVTFNNENIGYRICMFMTHAKYHRDSALNAMKGKAKYEFRKAVMLCHGHTKIQKFMGEAKGRMHKPHLALEPTDKINKLG
jgi:hypothetical protein